MALFSRKPKGAILKRSAAPMHWDVEDPFLFASHHEDDYPHGNRQLAPPLEEIGGRNLGRDYQMRFGFRMYHGKVVPGFPMHAHWGYETLTVPEVGYIDHFDHDGAHGRFGFGDAQWVMASSKYMHDEMYPLVNKEDRNPNDITQIMINIPLERKNKDNSVRTVWSEDIPVVCGEGSKVKVLCGEFGGASAESPSPGSWAVKENGVRILRISLDTDASVDIDPAASGANRNLYMVSGGPQRLVKDTDQYKVVLKDICRGYGVAFSLQVIEGCYCHDDGTWVDENTLLITLIGAPKKTVYNIASDVCKRFHQESVMVTACNTVHFDVKDKEKEEKKEKKKPKKK